MVTVGIQALKSQNQHLPTFGTPPNTQHCHHFYLTHLSSYTMSMSLRLNELKIIVLLIIKLPLSSSCHAHTNYHSSEIITMTNQIGREVMGQEM
jgi:hypothetical protein